jgi:ABC-type Fe3+-hydroxamate transport system substrate-binding protein
MEFKDQMNQIIRLEAFPKRIISLVPSQTEFLHDIGLTDEVVGITKFCIHPKEWFQTKNRVGGTKNVDFEKVKALKPDLIIGNKEENTKADIEALQEIAPVWMSDIYNLEDALEMMNSIGEMVDKSKETKVIVELIKTSSFDLLADIESTQTKLKVAYLIWKDPYLAAAKTTFIDELLVYLNVENFFADQERYPEWIPDSNNAPDLLFLSSEPYPFQEKHAIELQKVFPKTRIHLVDGEMFSWYGSRLQWSFDYFKKLKSELIY